MFGAFDHVGIAVPDLDAAIALYQDSFELPLVHRETLEARGIEAALLDVGESHVELIAPRGPDTDLAFFLKKRGPGLHHVAYRVDDVDATLAILRGAGVRLIDTSARTGVRGSRIAFLHPSATAGVLTEVVQPGDLPSRRHVNGVQP